MPSGGVHPITRSAPDREYERLAIALDERVRAAALYEEFVDGPLAVQIERIRRDLGLPAREVANDLAGIFLPAHPGERRGPS